MKDPIRKAAMRTGNKNDGGIASALAIATCSLLGTQAVVPVHADDNDTAWDFNTSVLYYGESDNRVQDGSLSLQVQRHFSDDRDLSLSLTLDTLTGASASGAIPLDRPQTFTSPSGNASYTTKANELPLDDTFLDTRVALTAGWSQPVGEDSLFTAGISASGEYDYFHLGTNLSFARNFNKNNTTLSAGLALARDVLDPVGGAPVGLSQMLDVGVNTNKIGGDQDKNVADVLVGFTQVLNRRAIAQFNYSYSTADGYLNDPYKIISVVDPVTGDTLIRSPATSGADGFYRFESRPDSRTKHSLFGQLKYYLNGQVLDASYRYMTDDWNIDSHTVDLRYRIPTSRYYWEPHLRLYTQSPAEFYRSSLVDGQPLPEFASSDYRLGDFNAITTGVKFGHTLKSGSEWSMRLEYYMQRGDIPAEQLIGNQIGRVEYPDLDAIIAQFSYKFGR